MKYKETGITLIALVVTIIILLVLAGVTIGFAMNGTGLFDKAKLATDEYNNKAQQEELELGKATNEISSYIDGHRGTVNLTEDEYNRFLNLEKMMKPNTWQLNVEYDFGDNIYGQRFTGNISANNTVDIINTDNKWHFIDAGGEAKRINDTIKWKITDNPATGTSTTSGYGFALWIENITGNPLRLVAGKNVGSCTYDIWVLYTKDE